MVYFVENPKEQWMMTGGTPILGNLQLGIAPITIYNYGDITINNGISCGFMVSSPTKMEIYGNNPIPLTLDTPNDVEIPNHGFIVH